MSFVVQEIGHLPHVEMADAIFRIIKDNDHLCQRWDQWTEISKVSTATRQLWALEEAVMLLRKPLIEFQETQMQVLQPEKGEHRQSTERHQGAKMRVTDRNKDKSNEMKKQEREREENYMEGEITKNQDEMINIMMSMSHFSEISNIICFRDGMASWMENRHMAHSDSFPKTDQAATIRRRLGKIWLKHCEAATDHMEATLKAPHGAESNKFDPGNARKASTRDLRSACMIKGLTEFSKSQPFKLVTECASCSLTFCLGLIRGSISPTETEDLVDLTANIIADDPDLQDAFSGWQSGTSSSVAAEEFKQCWLEHSQEEHLDVVKSASV